MAIHRNRLLTTLWVLVGLAGLTALARFLGPRVLIYASVTALVLFVIYALRNAPRRDRRHERRQIQQAVDHSDGQFRETNPEEPIPNEAASTVRRNDPCPCGSGEKYKRCCGLDQDSAN